MPSMAFAANYCPTIASVNMQIANNSAGWNGTSPLFLIIQAQPWGDVTPTGLVPAAPGARLLPTVQPADDGRDRTGVLHQRCADRPCR